MRGIKRQSLNLGHAETNGTELGKPRAGAVLPAAPADTVQSLRFVANADLFQLDSRAKHRRKLADEIPEVDAFLGSEIERELLAVPLPLGVGDLHHELIGFYALHRLPA